MKSFKRLLVSLIILMVLGAMSFQIKATTYKIDTTRLFFKNHVRLYVDHSLAEIPDLNQYFIETHNLEFIGSFKITHYTDAPDEGAGYLGTDGKGITATGNRVVDGYTCAMSSGYLPYGTVVWIYGLNDFRVVDDCGVSVGVIDVAVDNKKTAYEKGIYYSNVYVAGNINDEQFLFLKERCGG